MTNNLYKTKSIIIEAYDFSKTKVDNEGNNLYDDYNEETDEYYYNYDSYCPMVIRKDDFITIDNYNRKRVYNRDIFLSTHEPLNNNIDIINNKN